MSVTTIRLGQESEERLQALVETLQRSKSWIINEALREFIERKEQEQVRWEETLAAMESVAKGDVVAGEEVHAWLRSWGSDEEIATPGVSE
jgi:predicted transcriptional regulator